METPAIAATIQGGGFLIQPTDHQQIFTPEDFNEEQHMVIQMCNEFLDKEVLPVIVEMDAQQEGLMPSLVDKAGELGLLGASFPEQYGGLGKDFVTATLINEYLGRG